MNQPAYEYHIMEQMSPRLRPGRELPPLWKKSCPECGESKIIMLIPFHALWEDMDDETRATAYHDPQGFIDAWYTAIAAGEGG